MLKGMKWAKLQPINLQKIFQARRKQDIISIYVSSTEFKAVALERGTEPGVAYAYNRSFACDVEAKPWYEQELLLQECLGKVKEDLLRAEYKLGEITILLTIAGAAYVEVMDFPYLEKEELEEAVAWELPQRLPWEQGSYEYRYISKSKAQEQEALASLTDMQELTVYSMPKDYLAKLQTVCSSLNLVLAGFFVEEELVNEVHSFEEKIQAMDFYESFYNAEELQELRNCYFAPLISALSYAEQIPKIDFLSARARRKAELKQAAGSCSWLAIIMLCLSCLSCGAAILGEEYEEKALAEIKARYTKLLPWQDKMDEFNYMEGEIVKLKQDIALRERERAFFSRNILAIGNCLPKGCWLTRIEQQEQKEQKQAKKLLVEGRAENMELVMRFLEQLKQSQGFKSVAIVASNQEQTQTASVAAEIQSFKLVVELKNKQEVEKAKGNNNTKNKRENKNV